MTIEEEIAYWRRKAEEAETRELMMFCFGAEYGLRTSRDSHENKPAPTTEDLVRSLARLEKPHGARCECAFCVKTIVEDGVEIPRW